MSTTMRVAFPEDVEAILAIYTPIVRVTAISFEVEPPTTFEVLRQTSNAWEAALHAGMQFLRV